MNTKKLSPFPTIALSAGAKYIAQRVLVGKWFATDIVLAFIKVGSSSRLLAKIDHPDTNLFGKSIDNRHG